MPNGRRGSREVTGQQRIEGETWPEYERSVRDAGRERLPTTIETRRRPTSEDAEMRSATQRLKILEKNLGALEAAVEKAPSHLKHETYAQYQKYYEAEYLPALGHYGSLVTRRREEYLGELGAEAPELTPSELKTIGINIAYIQRTYAPREQEIYTERYMKQWSDVIGFRRYEAYKETLPEPAWYEFKKSPIGQIPIFGELATGFVKTLEELPIIGGKRVAEYVLRRPIVTRPREPLPFTPATFLGETAAYYAVGAGAGRVIGFAAPAFGGAAKAVTISPLTKVAARAGPKVVSEWARYGAAVARIGAPLARHPTVVKTAMFGTYGAFEAYKGYGMYKAGVPKEKIFMEVGKDIAMIWGFARGFPKGMETYGRARTWIESARGMRIPQAEMYEPIIRRGGRRFPTAPRGTSQAQLIREFKAGRYTARELLGTMPPEYKHLLKRTWAWHTTTAKFEPIMKVWGKRLSEQKGLYLAPSASPHFYRIPSPYGPPKTTLFGWGTPGRPTAYHIGVTDVLKAWTKTKPGAAHISKAFARRLKFEKEALLFPETLLERLPTKRAYSIWGGRRAVVQVYAAGGTGRPGALLESWGRISSRYAGTRALITPRELISFAYYAKSYARPSAPSIVSSYKPARYAPKSPFSVPSYRPSRRPRTPSSYRAPSYKSLPSIMSIPSPPTYPPSYPTYPPRPSLSGPVPSGFPLFFDEGKKKPRAKVPFFDLSKIYRERFFPMELFPMPRTRRRGKRRRRR